MFQIERGNPLMGKNKSYNKIDVVHDIDAVPSNVQSANREALLYVFEDNEAVIFCSWKYFSYFRTIGEPCEW